MLQHVWTCNLLAYVHSRCNCCSRTIAAGVCVWPGREGAALAVSAMLRQPLATVMLNFLPTSSTYYAAFAGEMLAHMFYVCVCMIHVRMYVCEMLAHTYYVCEQKGRTEGRQHG